MAEPVNPTGADAPEPPAQEDFGYYRQVEGTVSLEEIKTAPSVRLELLSRESDEPIAWRFRQPALSLFWWETGFKEYSLAIDGDLTRVTNASHSMTLVPPDVHGQGEFHNDRLCNYRVAFIDLAFLEDRGQFTLDRPLVGFSDNGLERSINELAMWRDDATYALMAEGWALQAVARLRRVMDAPEKEIAKGGLPAATMRRLEEYVRSRLHESITLVELAGIATLSVRHFARAFRTTTGQSPARYVHLLRIQLAKEMLIQPHLTITDIAFACGFTHSQHFTTSFRRSTGTTPSEFRSARLK